MEILSIHAALQQGRLFFTEHAIRQMAKRDIMDDERMD